MLALLLLQVSLFVSPLFLGEQPPESRSARALLVAWDHSKPETSAAARDSAEKLAKELALELRAGANFDELCVRARATSDAGGGAVLGTYFPGLLAPALDSFLFRAAEFEVSEPLESETGFQIAQRIDRLAGCRGILVAGKDPAARVKAGELLKKLKDGADFAELARANSDDLESKARGGAISIFERGPSDRLLKLAAFQLKVGEFAGPIESPLGLHLIQRVDPATLDPKLVAETVARLRLILVAFGGARGADAALVREHSEAQRIARELVAKLRAGEDMAELAAIHDDDRGGRTRRGDAGWIRRRTAQIDPLLDRVFTMRVGEVGDPIASDAGWLILRRER